MMLEKRGPGARLTVGALSSHPLGPIDLDGIAQLTIFTSSDFNGRRTELSSIRSYV